MRANAVDLRGGGAGPAWPALVAGTVAMASVVAGIVPIVADAGTLDLTAAPTATFALAGALIVVRRPRHRVGWLLSATGLVGATGFAAQTVALAGASTPGPLVILAAWYAEWFWLPWLYLMLVALPLLLPDGRLPEPGWRVVRDLAVLAGVVSTVAAMLQGRLLVDEPVPALDNPFGLLPYAELEHTPAVVAGVWALLTVLTLTATAGLLSRRRRARGVERQQLRVIMLGVGGCVVLFIANALADGLGVAVWPSGLVQPLMISLVPASILVAVLRYRLYEIDRIISRTVSYALVTAVLAGVYALVAVAPSAVVDLESDVLVATATLAAAAAFRPVRRRVQGLVDRRFDRSYYDARRVVDGFAARLHAHAQEDLLGLELRRVIAASVQPTHVTLWLRPGERR